MAWIKGPRQSKEKLFPQMPRENQKEMDKRNAGKIKPPNFSGFRPDKTHFPAKPPWQALSPGPAGPCLPLLRGQRATSMSCNAMSCGCRVTPEDSGLFFAELQRPHFNISAQLIPDLPLRDSSHSQVIGVL